MADSDPSKMKLIFQYIKSSLGYHENNFDSGTEPDGSRQSTPDPPSDAHCTRCGAQCLNCNSGYRLRGKGRSQMVGPNESTRATPKERPTKKEQESRDKELAEHKKKREQKENSGKNGQSRGGVS
ncbi:hypothetical protein K435DRAFT_836594 [Dendrothele bispora CBS 962.96]|uniref:Uncharacterized protein n=1 Tax=Dendrothele bispora (strain CBS 962.96) TaxID=1314807 RepID=A0A4S8MIN9_DENBC|nr:hypothetical protein K435DRAFT_836594 [Dendrothele bispora CBS 962.96]